MPDLANRSDDLPWLTNDELRYIAWRHHRRFARLFLLAYLHPHPMSVGMLNIDYYWMLARHQFLMANGFEPIHYPCPT